MADQTAIALLYAELAKRGISPQAASGAIAGLMGESGRNLDPTSFNTKDPGGGSGGIGQWNRDRLVGPGGMLAFAKNAGVPVNPNSPTDARKVPFGVQAQYLGHELDTTYSGVRDQLRAAQNPQQALNAWVNSYENPADKAGAIAQRSQYLAPVGTTLNSLPAQSPGADAPMASGPIDPSIIAHGGISPAIPDPSTPTPGAVASGTLPGFTTPDASSKFLKGADQFAKAAGGESQDGGGQQSKAPPMLQPQAPHAAQGMGQTLNSVPPLQWGTAPPGASASAQPMGTTLSSLQQMQQMMMMLGAYGGTNG